METDARFYGLNGGNFRFTTDEETQGLKECRTLKSGAFGFSVWAVLVLRHLLCWDHCV